MNIVRILVVLIAYVVIVACSADESSFGADPSRPGGVYDVGGEPVSDAGTADDAGGDVFVPEEPEPFVDRGRPVATQRFLYVASRSLSTVAKIDAESLAVTPIRVGADPRIVAAVPGAGDTVVVLNAGADTLSIIRSAVDGDDVTHLDVLPGCNRVAVSPSGRHVAAWYDNRAARSGDEIGSLQEVSLVDLSVDEVFALSVGFSVRDVQFDASGTQGFFITDTGVSALDLGGVDGDLPVPPVPFGDEGIAIEADYEILVSSDGRHAIRRAASDSGVRILEFSTGEVAAVELPEVPTDVDLVEGDAMVLAAMRDSGRVAAIDIESAFSEAVDITFHDVPAPVGLIAVDAEELVALTYTTVSDVRRMGFLPLSGSGDAGYVALQKPPRAVLTGPTPTAVVVHEPDADSDETGAIGDVARSWGVSLVDLPSRYAKLSLAPAEPVEVLFTDGGGGVVLRFEGADVARQLLLLDTESFASRTVELVAPVEAFGAMPGAERIFVSQEAENGRITFIDLQSGEQRHISAFLLNAYID